MPGKTRKATFNLHTDVLVELDEMASRGIVTSKNALVEQALVKELKELRRKERQQLWQEGAADPLLLRDIEATESSFRDPDAETARRIV